MRAQRQLGKKKGPTSKLYLAESVGDTQIQNNDKVYTGQMPTHTHRVCPPLATCSGCGEEARLTFGWCVPCAAKQQARDDFDEDERRFE